MSDETFKFSIPIRNVGSDGKQYPKVAAGTIRTVEAGGCKITFDASLIRSEAQMKQFLLDAEAYIEAHFPETAP